jgi:hypothetical protein
MHWDGRFAIGVSLIWAMLVLSAFHLVKGIQNTAPPTPVLADNPAMDGKAQIAHQ